MVMKSRAKKLNLEFSILRQCDDLTFCIQSERHQIKYLIRSMYFHAEAGCY